jgi:hypothetical protein
MRRKLAIFALAVAAAIPSASLADPNKDCPGGPPGHCKSGTGHGQSQQQQQEQTQNQSQCLISFAVLGNATCSPAP